MVAKSKDMNGERNRTQACVENQQMQRQPLPPRHLTLGVALTTAACLTSDSMLYVVLPLHWREAGLTHVWQVGVLLAINRLVRLVTNVGTGWLYQRIAPQTGVVWAVGLSVVISLGYAFGQGFAVWCLLRMVWGCAWSLLRIGGLLLVSATAAEGRTGREMGWYNGVYRLGSLVGALVGGWAVTGLGLHGTSIILAPLPVLCLPWLLRARAGGGPLYSPARTDSGVAGRAVLSWSRWGLVMAGGWLVSLVYQGLFVATLSEVLSIRYPQGVSWARFALSVAFVSGLIQAARWAWEPLLGAWVGRLADTWRHARRLPGLTVVLAAGLLLSLQLPAPATVFGLLCLLVLATGTALTVLTDMAAAQAARRVGSVQVLSSYALLQDIGAATGPVLGYVLLALHHSAWAYPLLAGLLLIWGAWHTLAGRTG
ncbi:MAG: MFS transporter [Alicyclobacillus sp.]|nr:MFS transporter [Alicyclobacillus sp.]